VQLEAMACSKPVINTNLESGVPFVSPNGVSGLTVKPRSSAELSRAMRLLFSDPGLRKQYGRSGRIRVETKFDLSLMTRRTLDLYSEVMSVRATSQRPVEALRSAAISQ